MAEPTAPREDDEPRGQDQEHRGELVPFPAYPPYPPRIRATRSRSTRPGRAAELVHQPATGSRSRRGPASGARSSRSTCAPWPGYAAPRPGTAALLAHRGAYHGDPVTRLPAQGVRVGGVRAAGHRSSGLRRWWWLAEQTRLRSLAVIAGDSREWRNLHKDAKNTRRDRGLVLLAAAFGPRRGRSRRWWTFAPWWGWAILAAVALPLLARAGRPADKKIIRAATTTPRFRVINADVVLRAYYAAGLGNPDKPGQQVTFGAPMSRDGDGSRVLVDLPYGKGLDDAVKAREAIASGLDVTPVPGVHPP